METHTQLTFTEHSEEPWEVVALLLIDLRTAVPPHDCVKCSTQKPAIAVGLVLSARRYRESDVIEHLKGGELTITKL